MTVRTDAWWVCSKCDVPVARIGKGAKQAMLDHRKVCDPIAGFSMQQVPQTKS